jgi:hypothetical protein
MSSASGVFQRLQEFYLSVLHRRSQHEAPKTDPLAGRAAFRGVEPLEPRLLLSVLLSEGFEGSFPNDNGWTVGDSNPLGATAYWGAVDSSYGGEGTHSGARKGYCAGVGASGGSASPHYTAYMDAYMFRTINLSGYSNANLSFWYKIPDIEENYDYAYVYVDSTLVWWKNERVTSWTNETINLNSFLGGVHTLLFEFTSDININLEGWYLDDITVTVDSTSDDPNDQFFEATSTSPGNSVSGTISSSGSTPDPRSDPSDVDMYSFTVAAGQKIDFDLDRTSGNLDSYIRLFNSSGTELTYNDDAAAPGETLGTDSYLQYTFPSAGTYYMGVSSYENRSYNPVTGTGDNGSSTTGSYTLTLTNVLMPDPNDQISEAIMTSVGSTVSGEISSAGSSPDPGLDAGDVDMYGFTVSAGQKVCFDIDRPSGSTLDSYIRLFNSSGTILKSNRDGQAPGEPNSDDSYMEYTFTQAGTYYLGVSAYPNSAYNPTSGASDSGSTYTGAYTLSLLPPNQAPAVDTFTADPNPVLVGQTVQLTVTAHDTDGGELRSVSFFRDANGNNVAEAGEKIGEDLLAKDGWTFDWDTFGQLPPSVKLLAVAYDDRAGASTPKPLTLTLQTEAIPPEITGWSSAATHNAAGEILLAIPDDDSFVESRGLRRLVIQFSEAIRPASLTAGSVQLAGIDAYGNGVNLTGISISTSTRNGDTEGVIVFSPALPDSATYTVRIQAVTDLVGNPLSGDDDRIITALLCDADGDAAVGASDYIALKRALGSPVSSANAAADFDCSGTLGFGDLMALQCSMGHCISPAIVYLAEQQLLAQSVGSSVEAEPQAAAPETAAPQVTAPEAAAAEAAEPQAAALAAAASIPRENSFAWPLAVAKREALIMSSPPRLSTASAIAMLSAARLPAAEAGRTQQMPVDVLRLTGTWAGEGSDPDALPEEAWVASPLMDVLGRARSRGLNPARLDLLGK